MQVKVSGIGNQGSGIKLLPALSPKARVQTPVGKRAANKNLTVNEWALMLLAMMLGGRRGGEDERARHPLSKGGRERGKRAHSLHGVPRPTARARAAKRRLYAKTAPASTMILFRNTVLLHDR
jgi:anaerobic selenocysteine-containing dehydrogenase